MRLISSDRPLLYDVFCGAGGATRGYQEAGFRVVGVDNRPQPRYCGDGFIQLDAFEFFAQVARGEFPQPAAYHCSPPCQAYTSLGSLHKDKTYPDLLAPTRDALVSTGKPWVIENVVGAPLRGYVQLCGAMFGLRVYRHRRFESPCFFFQPRHPRHTLPALAHRAPSGKSRKAAYLAGECFASVTGNAGNYAGPGMGIDWMIGEELSQAIPPAYCEFIGRQLLNYV
jgi:DNA (cytosine-5)-methyltransferase 1